jgi:hypothetical protein
LPKLDIEHLNCSRQVRLTNRRRRVTSALTVGE